MVAIVIAVYKKLISDELHAEYLDFDKVRNDLSIGLEHCWQHWSGNQNSLYKIYCFKYRYFVKRGFFVENLVEKPRINWKYPWASIKNECMNFSWQQEKPGQA